MPVQFPTPVSGIAAWVAGVTMVSTVTTITASANKVMADRASRNMAGVTKISHSGHFFALFEDHRMISRHHITVAYPFRVSLTPPYSQ